ncbi:MAG: hypothetical protein HYX75_13280 [Acidobacteria bacterium]|nr:hypothetical protein [Acidobacteriota bacterium]
MNVIEILEDFQQKNYAGQYKDIVDAGERLWSVLAAERGTAEVTECCRLVFYSCTQLRDFARAEAWRARVLSSACLSGTLNSVVALLIPLAFAAHGKGNTAAGVQVLEEMRVLMERLCITEEGYQGRDMLWELYFEKMGFFLCAQGRFREAVTSYENAEKYEKEGTPRWYKVRFGGLLARFLQDSAGVVGNDVKRETALLLARLKNEPELKHEFVRKCTEHNVRYMNGKEKDWMPYEVL